MTEAEVDAYQLGQLRMKQWIWHPSFVNGHCFPQAHMTVTKRASGTDSVVSTCLRCSFRVTFTPTKPDYFGGVYD